MMYRLNSDFLVIRGQLSERRATSSLGLPFVFHQCLKPHAPMSANAAVINLALIQELNQRRARNVQHVRLLLGSEFGMYWNQRYSVATRHFLKNTHQHPHSGRRYLDSLLRGAINYPETHEVL